MSVSSAAANIIFKRKPFILAKNSSELPIKNRIPMVDKRPRYLQWLIINSAFCAGSHKNRLKSFEVGDHNYCRMLSERIEFNSRLGISKHFRLLRVDAESSNFSESLPNKGFFRDRFVCIPSITSDTNLRCMETRSSQSCMLIKSPVLLPWRKDLLKNPNREIHTLVQNRSLKLVARMVSGLDCRRRGFQMQLPTLYPGQEDQILMQIMSRPGESGIVAVLEGKLIHFLVIQMKSLTISLIYISKDSNTVLLIIKDQQFLLFRNRYRENL